jgi:hypothetical protein
MTIALEHSVAAGRGRSIDGRQNRYLCVTMGTIAEFVGDVMGLKYPWS